MDFFLDLFPGVLASIALLAGVLVAVLIGIVVLRRLIHGPPSREQRGRTFAEQEREKVRAKYFEKERRMREMRRRTAPHTSYAPPPSDRYAKPSPRERRREVAPSPTDPARVYAEVLGVSGEPTAESVRRAYLLRISEYHPDRVAPMGPKIRAVAEEETKRINEAYRFFRDRLGF
ncbi:hypothetical protein BH23BAC4_BH23BAC4_13300 [soil metagenome]